VAPIAPITSIDPIALIAPTETGIMPDIPSGVGEWLFVLK
jgi:hypothetical protein